MDVRGTAGGRERGGLDLHLDLRPDETRAARGVGPALEAALREAVRSGRLAAGARLPGSRVLAVDLGLSRGTVVQVYAQLTAEGWLIGVPGSCTRVADLHAGTTRASAPRDGMAAPPDVTARDRWPVDLRPGRPDLGSFPRTAWASSVRRAVSAADPAAFDYGDPAGEPALRTAVAGYVSRTRGARVAPESVVITPGFAGALALLARMFQRLGVRRAAIEDPCLERHRRLLRGAGLVTDPLHVDADGADPAGLRDDAGAVLLTPAHQHPRGVVLAPRRRTAFVEWARRTGGYVIEDDYDGEFRYDRQPLGALQALAPDHVVLGGTTGKALAPGMRIGWLVLPAALRAPLLDMVEETAAAVPVIDQLALADLITRGDYDRHVRRLRADYRRRRAELAARLATVTATPLDGVAAGLHALLPVGSAERERRLVAAGERAGLRLHGLRTSGLWHTARDAPAALVIGYATPPRHAWRHALDRLTALIEADGFTGGP